MAALNLITFADAAGSRAGVLLSGGRVLDLAVAMPPARDMLAVIDGGAAMLAAIRALAANPPPNAVLPLAARHDVFVATAAVADWRPAECGAQKIKKDGSGRAPSIAMTENPDILAAVARLPGRPPGPSPSRCPTPGPASS